MGEWPAVPEPGEFVQFPVDLPPTWLAALGFVGGQGRWAALIWLPADQGLLVWDGQAGVLADLRGWDVYAGHRLGAVLLEPYELRSSGELLPEFGLVADVRDGVLSVGRLADIGRLVQGRPLDVGGHLAGGQDLLDAASRTGEADGAPPARVLNAHDRRSRVARQEVRRFLDYCVGLIRAVDWSTHPAEPTPAGPASDGPASAGSAAAELPGPDGLDLG